MFPLFKPVVQPTLAAAGARRIVEIGALQGETTIKLLSSLGPEAELHVIDPVPQFDPSEHERRFPGQYHFHRSTSHEVLPGLPAMDAALIDGDHNWYTVYNELKMLEASADEAGEPLPLLFLHDVGWPYGRRDLYYAPERIPEEQRQPYAQRGLRLRAGRDGRTDLLKRGGFNEKMNNALEEGGPRNGVMTALEDFIDERDCAVRLWVLPMYFGLAVAADERLIAKRPELESAFARFESPGFLREMLTLAERLRVKEMHWGQVVFYHWQDRLDRVASLYLGQLQIQLGAAALGPREEELESLRLDKVDGALVECGAAGTDRAVFMGAFAQAHDLSKAPVWLLEANGSRPNELLERLGLQDGVRMTPHSVEAAPEEGLPERIALLSIATDAEPRLVLERLYDRVVPGGLVSVDLGGEGARRRAECRSALGSSEELEELDRTIRWRKL